MASRRGRGGTSAPPVCPGRINGDDYAPRPRHSQVPCRGSRHGPHRPWRPRPGILPPAYGPPRRNAASRTPSSTGMPSRKTPNAVTDLRSVAATPPRTHPGAAIRIRMDTPRSPDNAASAWPDSANRRAEASAIQRKCHPRHCPRPVVSCQVEQARPYP
jgi:hypothetical protein